MAYARNEKLENPFTFNYPIPILETDYYAEDGIAWYAANWQGSIVASVIYVILIFWGQKYMRKKEKCDLRTAMALWSGTLAVFSIITAVRLLPETYFVINKYGWDYTVCNPSVYFGHTAIWAFLFATSKIYELGDTAFIVLRKQPLIFLHWYHHITVLIYSWYTYSYFYAPGRWFALVNSLVHSFMYTYYTLRALRFKMPKWVNISITSIQLTQMLVGIAVNLRVYFVLNSGEKCHVTYDNIKYSMLMYFSYLVLFAHFFYGAYLKPKPSKSSPAPVSSNADRKQNNAGKYNGHVQNGLQHRKSKLQSNKS